MRNHPLKHRFWLTGTALACAAVIGLAGCSDSTGPNGEFDPESASAAAGDIGSAMAGNPALASMAVMGEFFPSFAAAPIAATVPFDPQTAEDGRNWIDKRRGAFQAWSEGELLARLGAALELDGFDGSFDPLAEGDA